MSSVRGPEEGGRFGRLVELTVSGAQLTHDPSSNERELRQGHDTIIEPISSTLMLAVQRIRGGWHQRLLKAAVHH